MASAVSLAFVLTETRVTNEDALPLGPAIGWWLLVGACLVALMFIVQADRWKRWWMSADDPRSMALFRIVFAFFTICNLNGLWEYFGFLFTDEGIFTADVARQVFAAHQFAGFGDGGAEPYGFFDARGVGRFLAGPKYSLLYFWDSPTAFWIHLWAFEIAAFCLMIGFRTRVAGIATFVLMNSIFHRNHLFWEGTELVYRCFLAILILSRSGHAYSIDNWLRCRKLRKQGLLSVPGGPGDGAGVAPNEEHPRGLQAIYRRIPAWPRRLAMLQLATIYCYTGVVKNGAVWARGDAFYYALNMDHFYRFYPQPMSSLLGNNVFRVMTWVTHWWEVFFPLVLIGLITRWAIAEKLPRLAGWRRHVVRGCWAGLAIVAMAVCVIAWPVHGTPFRVEWFIAGWLALMTFIGVAWWWMGNRAKRFDLQWFCTWFLGRRVWLFLAVVFQSHVFVMMNIGHFQTGMTSALIPFLGGLEVAGILRAVARRKGPPIPAEDPRLPHLHRDDTTLPLRVLLGALALGVLGVLLKVAALSLWWLAWIAALALVLGAAIAAARRKPGRTADDRPAWAYGPFGRALFGSLVVWQLVAVATWLVPEKDCVKSFREPARAVFAKWLTVTQTDQSWGMFAPNPPRSNVFLKVLVTDEAGDVWDLRTDVYAAERKPIPWVWNDRQRKMNRRIIGGESGPTDWYRKWFARHHCREWALTHDGVAPRKVELVKVSYQIPSPDQVFAHGWYSPEQLLERTGTEKVEYTEQCAKAVMGQLSDELRARHGLPPLPEGQRYKPWVKKKVDAWTRPKTD
ncbi:MAG TPA: hypothetical protein VG755_18870 [Nannocystaceae bacterium]|nr:hypothetical protein [Nannocystaceae bacterium]